MTLVSLLAVLLIKSVFSQAITTFENSQPIIKVQDTSNQLCTNGKKPKQHSPHLHNCRKFHLNSCCNREEANHVYSIVEKVYAAQYAVCPACLHNLAALQCSVACSPDQRDYVLSPQPPSIVSLTTAASTHSPSTSISITPSTAAAPATTTTTPASAVDRTNPVVQLCESFCLTLFRSCGDVKNIGRAGSNKTIPIEQNDELASARKFCINQFSAFPNLDAVVIADNAVIHGTCYGHDVEEMDVCDPYRDQRFWNVVGASMKNRRGVTLLIVCMLLIAAAFCVGYNMLLVRRKRNWLMERRLKERQNNSTGSNERYARSAGNDEGASFLVNDKYALQ
jgi:hypothetical protein